MIKSLASSDEYMTLQSLFSTQRLEIHLAGLSLAQNSSPLFMPCSSGPPTCSHSNDIKKCFLDVLIFVFLEIYPKLAFIYPVAKDNLELLCSICLCLLSTGDYRHAPTCSIYAVLGTEHRTLCMFNQYCTN